MAVDAISKTTWLKFRNKRNDVISMIRNAKINHYHKQAEQLHTQENNQKNWWKIVKKFLNQGNSSECNIPPIKSGNTYIFDDLSKAEAFNKYFIEQSTLDVTNASLPPIYNPPTSSFDIEFCQIEEILKVLNMLKISKACGPDLISPRLLKEGSVHITLPLKLIFNDCLNEGYFPDVWKMANVNSSHKKESRELIPNYRPISLLSCVGKCLARLVCKPLLSYLIENIRQSGFVPNDSTINQLLDIYNMFCSAIDDGKEVRVVFCDISKAFDKVWHKGLLFKLKKMGIKGKVYNLLENYLKNRKQRVVINGATSTWSDVLAGVPQGSVLGPVLFLIFINDIVDNIESDIRLFADDTSLSIIVESPEQAANLLNRDIAKIMNWADRWLVTFNPDKTETLIVSLKTDRPFHPPLVMNGSILNDLNQHKHLGVTFTSDCSWHVHLEIITSKAKKRLAILRGLKYKLDRKSLQKLYFSYIRPIIEYADVIWDNCTQYEKDSLEKLNIEAMRIITGATVSCKKELLYRECRWDSLQFRRKNHKLVQFHKMFHKTTPQYLSSLVPPPVSYFSEYPLRNGHDLRNFTCKKSIYLNSFLPSTIDDWNHIPLEVRNNPSLSNFKMLIWSIKPKVPRYYFQGNRHGQIFHTQLRLECSSLKYHLFINNIIDSPNCSCSVGGRDPTHYL